MAFLCRAPSSQPQTQLLNLGFHRAISSPQLPPVSNFPCTPLSSRFNNELRLRVRRRMAVVFASNTVDPVGGDSKKEKSDAQGPPFLTILAGLLLFLLVFWLLGSIVMWLFGLIVKSPPSK
ncbi:uncharacterized protein LOC117928872 [Vitis riparia]|uniref:uncharacterized protein LOC117928872 n=1 Tax=Vitis riparia TaxID=96939 RepID=UPI00155A138F|nr:uncharacterized protein LOC117928872 [Vitis riparia]